MSKRIESDCVDCGLPCLGNSCRYHNMTTYYCDVCGSEGAEYIINGDDYCEDCAKKYLKDAFEDLELSEQAEVLDIDMNIID